MIRGQAQGTRKFDWYPLFRSTNLCYGPACSGEGIYCVTALKEKETADKNRAEIHISGQGMFRFAEEHLQGPAESL